LKNLFIDPILNALPTRVDRFPPNGVKPAMSGFPPFIAVMAPLTGSRLPAPPAVPYPEVADEAHT
jgi:hypothetical protein